MSIRVAANAGSFYPANAKDVKKLIDIFNSYVAKSKLKSYLNLTPKAIISPHAGYIYSGFTANIAHRVLANRKVKRVVVIGPSHHVYFRGVSGSFFDEYQTPFGNLTIDKEYLNVIAKKFKVGFVKKAHQLEHSTETQMPFIKYYQPNVEVIELIYGDVDYKVLSSLVSWLLEDSLTSVVISTDLSHFYTLEKANKLDAICINGIEKLDTDILDIGCEACGIIGVKAIVKSAKELNLKSIILDYRTSADTSGDKTRVVGYVSAAIGWLKYPIISGKLSLKATQVTSLSQGMRVWNYIFKG